MTIQKAPIWNRLPCGWIENEGLKTFRWVAGQGANNLAALMVLTAISHVIDPATGVADITYDDLETRTELSRAKIAAAIKILVERNLVLPSPDQRSVYTLVDYGKTPWAKFPVRGHYQSGKHISAFRQFKLRSSGELDAMKLYFLIASRRDKLRNAAFMSYDTISDYSGIPRVNITRAISFLALNSLVRVTTEERFAEGPGVMSAYRLTYLDSHIHPGTTGRRQSEFEPIPDTADQL